jgi:hypothetical protein
MQGPNLDMYKQLIADHPNRWSIQDHIRPLVEEIERLQAENKTLKSFVTLDKLPRWKSNEIIGKGEN